VKDVLRNLHVFLHPRLPRQQIAVPSFLLAGFFAMKR
jgi:hypothetical protein